MRSNHLWDGRTYMTARTGLYRIRAIAGGPTPYALQAA